MEKDEIKEIIEEAVILAYNTWTDGIDKKLQEAVKAGVETGVKAAVKAAERKRRNAEKQQYDRRLHNTKLLLRNYRALNAHYHNAVFDVRSAEESDETFAEIMQRMNASHMDEELYVESIKQSAVRTKVIMSHVNRMLEVYETMCRKSERPEAARHWRALDSVYLNQKAVSVSTVAARENISKRTVYKDLDICMADLATLFFGIDGMKRK